MAVGNTVDLTGNVTRDPELRYTPGGMPVASFGLAVNRRIQDRQSQEWKEQVSFFDVVCFGSLGENAAESLQKGTRVLVSGRLEQRSWETPDGDKRSKIEIIADEVGPSLRWASAEITRNPPTGGGGGGGGYNDRPAQNQPSGGGRPAGGGQSGGGYDYDEEPF